MCETKAKSIKLTLDSGYPYYWLSSLSSFSPHGYDTPYSVVSDLKVIVLIC